MRILHFIQSLEIGGSETQCVLMAKLLAANGHAVTVGCMRQSGPLGRDLQESGVELIEFPVASLLHAAAWREMMKLVRYIRQERFNVVHANDLYANLFAVPAAKLAGIPVIISSQRDLSDSLWYTPVRRKILRHVQNLSDCVLVNSEAIRRQLESEKLIPPGKITVVYNGIDVDRYCAQSQPPGPAPLTDTGPRQRRIVMVANMHREVKGHPELIEAAEQVCRRHGDARFVLVGDGEMRAEFEKRVHDKGLQNHFSFLGHRSDVPQILARCEIGVLASRAEGLPNAVMEYMAAGLATVATNVGGIPELIEHRTNGLLVEPCQPAKLARHLLALLEDEALGGRLGAAARQTVVRLCSFSSLLSRLTGIYENSGRGLNTRLTEMAAD